MTVPRYGNSAVDEGADECPDETRDGLRPATEQLQAKGHAVDVWAIVRDDAEGQDDEAELAEAAEGRKQHGGEEPADTGLIIAVCVAGVEGVEGRRRDGQAEHFGETEGYDETGICPGEGFDSGDCDGLIDGVIRCVTRPTGSESEHGCRK